MEQSNFEEQLNNQIDEAQVKINRLNDLTESLKGKSYIVPPKIEGQPDAVELTTDHHNGDAIRAADALVDIPDDSQNLYINKLPKAKTIEDFGFKKFVI